MRDGSGGSSGLGRAWLLISFALVIAPTLLAAWVAPDLRSWDALLGVSGIVAYVSVLIAAFVLYAHWRLSAGPTGWLVLGITALTINALSLHGMIAADPEPLEARPNLMLVLEVAVAVGVLALVVIAARRTLTVDPIVVGVLIGLGLTAVRVLLLSSVQPIDFSARQRTLLELLIAATAIAIAFALFRLTVAEPRVRWSLSGAWLLLSFGHLVAFLDSPGAILTGATVATNAAGAALILSVSAQLAWVSSTTPRETLDRTRRELEKVQADLRGDAAQLHELRATVAGLTSANHLLHGDTALPAERRASIEAMIDSEMDRLQRLLHSGPTSEPAVIDLDRTIEPLVLRHQVRGFRVRWQPSGQRVFARADDVAEVINVLLENAFQHARSAAGVLIYTRRIDDVVEIAIADSGPGVDRAIRSRIFEWGGRGEDSGGSGIGLTVAHQLSVELGGYLRLVDTPALGATFVLGLPAEERR